ncbi:MAG: hypothetical protein R3E32_24025 [Chitinophagales bacterium]
MSTFRLLLVIFFLSIGVYTIYVGIHHGIDLFSVFLDNIAAMNWSGQFNLDFTSYLVLSGVWLAWRHHFSPKGLILGLIGTFAGMMFLAPYLLVASFEAKGDMKEVFMGSVRAKN